MEPQYDLCFEISPSPNPLPIQLFTQTSRPQCQYHCPARYDDIPPEEPAPLPDLVIPPEETPTMQCVIPHVQDTICTGLN
jgi:hypothetical protein